MEIREHIAVLRREGALLAAAVAASGPDAPVPTCPDWRVRDLVRHVGGVHRWAAAHVAEGRARPIADLDAVVAAWPGDGDLLEWFCEGHARLAATLEEAPPDLDCWSFLPAPSPLAFWARRQAHETAIHRVDAESAAGMVTRFAPEVAADGIDELVMGFVSRPGGRLRSDPPRTLAILPTDVEAGWRVLIGPDGSCGHREPGDAGCTVRGAASDLHLLLWNRRDTEGIEVLGDAELMERWRSSVQVRWR
ncbi:MAG TPA: maleylpyruvate isomerase family mycothiol-dependent enzyme [Candidatus Dormibacteraeota bacterium]